MTDSGFSPDTPSLPPKPMDEAMKSGKPGKQPKKSSKIIASILIIIGVLGIIGAGVYFYLAYKSETPEPVVEAPVTETQEEQAIDATPEGVDTAIKKIDESLSTLDDTADFPQTELSDDSLGL